MTVVASVQAPEHLLGRITASLHRGRSYVYTAGKDHVFRYHYDAGALTLDRDWGPVRTRQPGESPASAITTADGWIFLQGNAGPAPVPFTIHAISQDDGARTPPRATLPRPRLVVQRLEAHLRRRQPPHVHHRRPHRSARLSRLRSRARLLAALAGRAGLLQLRWSWSARPRVAS
jgi:hypothetical protein